MRAVQQANEEKIGKFSAVPRSNASRNKVSAPKAGELFTDRTSQSSAFAAALAAHRAYMDSDEDSPSARNLMVFYGVGGIGKTTLSERLEQWVGGKLSTTDLWGPPPATGVAATCRIDLHRSQGRVDMVSNLVSIRRAFGRVEVGGKRVKRWPAFDLAFTAYWSAIHPGEDLPGGGTQDSAFADSVTDTISEVLSELGVPGSGIATKSIRTVVRRFREWHSKQTAFDKYDGFEDLLTRCAEVPTPDDPHPELLAEVASLLNDDLCTWEGPAPLIVTFVDTFERLTSDSRRTDESTLNQLVWRLPNVLFIATGRNLIDWYDDSRTNLHVVGRALWPGLVPGANQEPRQHLVGVLAPEDRISIIRLGRELYGIPITDDVVERLATASGGLPQYLDLALALSLTRMRNDGPPITVEDVTGSLSELVLRVLEDVPEDEQRALRAAALFPFFDAELVATAAKVDHGCALRAMDRPMIDRRGTTSLPYTMHDAIREAIRRSPHNIKNGWSDKDWRHAGERALDAVHARHQHAKEAKDTTEILQTLALAIVLVCDQDLTIGPSTSPTYRDWLAQAIVFGPSIAGLRPLLPTNSRTEIGKGILDFVIAKTTEVTADEAAELLTGVFESDHPLRLAAGRHRGYVLRNSAQWDEALAAFDELVAASPTDLNRYQRAFTFASARRFRQAVDESFGLSEDRIEAIKRSCRLAHGRFDGYFEARHAALQKLRQQSRIREAIENEGNSIRWRAFLHGDVDFGYLDVLQAEAEAASHLTGMRDAYLAKLFLDPRLAIAEPDTRTWFENVDRSKNAGEIGWRTALAQIVLALSTDNLGELEKLANTLNRRQKPRGRMWISTECLLDSYGWTVPPEPSQWLEPYETVRDRWRGHFDHWKARIEGSNHLG